MCILATSDGDQTDSGLRRYLVGLAAVAMGSDAAEFDYVPPDKVETVSIFTPVLLPKTDSRKNSVINK